MEIWLAGLITSMILVSLVLEYQARVLRLPHQESPMRSSNSQNASVSVCRKIGRI